MNSFRKEYQKAVDELPEFHMDAGRVQDELHHRRMQSRRRNRLIVRGCTAAALFILCGAGTVAAKGYIGSIIRVQDNGYTVTAHTADGGEMAEDAVEPEMAGEGRAVEPETAEEGRTVEPEVRTEQSTPESAPEKENATANLCDMEKRMDSLSDETGASENETYKSLGDFLEHSAAAAKIPDLAMLESEFCEEQVSVINDSMIVYVMVISEGKYFSLMQTDYRGVESYSSGTAYTGQTVNERSYRNSQGLSYTLFDTIGDDGGVEATHAVISLEGRELSMDFHGFEAESIEKVLADLNLTVYFSE